MIVFWLVDPKRKDKLVSTRQVVPQQQSWFKTEILNKEDGKDTFFDKGLASDMVSKILDYLDYPLSWEKAKEHREKLMEERKYVTKENNTLVFEREFSLCEH